jgi:hypothetical protein
MYNAAYRSIYRLRMAGQAMGMSISMNTKEGHRCTTYTLVVLSLVN